MNQLWPVFMNDSLLFILINQWIRKILSGLSKLFFGSQGFTPPLGSPFIRSTSSSQGFISCLQTWESEKRERYQHTVSSTIISNGLQGPWMVFHSLNPTQISKKCPWSAKTRSKAVLMLTHPNYAANIFETNQNMGTSLAFADLR